MSDSLHELHEEVPRAGLFLSAPFNVFNCFNPFNHAQSDWIRPLNSFRGQTTKTQRAQSFRSRDRDACFLPNEAMRSERQFKVQSPAVADRRFKGFLPNEPIPRFVSSVCIRGSPLENTKRSQRASRDGARTALSARSGGKSRWTRTTHT
jgi:hypothetical protein